LIESQRKDTPMPLSRFKSPKRSQENIQGVLDALITHIKSVVDPIDVFLIGSYVRGTADEFSDIDLVVVVPDERDASSTNFSVVQNRPYREYPLDLIVLNQSEFQKMKNIGGIAFEATHYGKCLSGKDT